MRTLLLVTACLVLAAGCGPLAGPAMRFRPDRLFARPAPPVVHDPVLSRYRDPRVDWTSVRRVLLMPLANESLYPEAAEDLRRALANELQALGRFELVAASPEARSPGSESVHVSGRFDEREVLETSFAYRADGVLIGSVTQYHPYAPPRIGLSLQLVSPAESVVIGSIDGLWDSRDKETAARAVAYHHANTLHPATTLLDGDRVFESPELYRKFVSHEVAWAVSELFAAGGGPGGGDGRVPAPGPGKNAPAGRSIRFGVLVERSTPCTISGAGCGRVQGRAGS